MGLQVAVYEVAGECIWGCRRVYIGLQAGVYWAAGGCICGCRWVYMGMQAGVYGDAGGCNTGLPIYIKVICQPSPYILQVSVMFDRRGDDMRTHHFTR